MREQVDCSVVQSNNESDTWGDVGFLLCSGENDGAEGTREARPSGGVFSLAIFPEMLEEVPPQVERMSQSIRTRAKLSVVLTVLFVVLAPACTFRNLSFKEDTRLEIIAPEALSTVRLPFTIRWQVEDFPISPPDGTRRPDAGYFALFFDRDVVAPGEDLRWLAKNDESCMLTPGCPDESYLNRRNVYTTTDTAFVVESLTDTRPPDRPQTKDRHEATIVLLNGASERIGESAFSVKFIVDRL